MSANPRYPITDAAAADRGAERKIRITVESWENEGGHLAPRLQAPLTPSDVSPVVVDQALESAALAAMRAKFLSDFAGGSMGMHHNSFQHRSRVLRQMNDRRPR